MYFVLGMVKKRVHRWMGISLNSRLLERSWEVSKFNVPKVRILESLSSKRASKIRYSNPLKTVTFTTEATMRQTQLSNTGDYTRNEVYLSYWSNL